MITAIKGAATAGAGAFEPGRKPGDDTETRTAGQGRFADVERFNGARRQGFAFGKRTTAVVVAEGTVVAGNEPAAPPQPVTEAGQVLAHATVPVSPAPQAEAGPGNGHAAGSVVLLAQARVAAKAHPAPVQPTGPLVDKVAEFLARRDDVANKADEADAKQPNARKPDRQALAAAGLLPTPEGDILNIHDTRFNTGKFTGREVLSLEIAAGFDARKPGRRVGQTADHQTGKAGAHEPAGRAVGRKDQEGENAGLVSRQVLHLLRHGLYA